MAVNQTQGVVLAIFGASAGGHLSALDANATANGLASLATDLSASAGLILGVNLASDSAFTSNVLANLGIPAGTEGYTLASNYFTTNLAAGAGRGDLVASAVEYLLGSNVDASLTDVASTFTTTVADAVTYSQGAGATVFSVAQLRAQQDNAGGDGSSFALTAEADSFVLTAGNDTVTGASGTVQNTDTILDSSTTDADSATLEVTGASLAPRIQNVETVNVNGKYTVTGIDLSNISGASTLNLSTAIVTGTATVTEAATINAGSINALTNVDTLNVEAAASGTRDAVVVNAQDVGTLKLTVKPGADTFNVFLNEDVAVTIAEDSAGDGATDSITLNTEGTDVDLTGDATVDTVVLTNTGDAATYDVTTAIGKEVEVNGDVTLSGAIAAISAGDKITQGTNAGNVVVELTDTTIAAGDLTDEEVDQVVLTKTGTGVFVIDLNEASTVLIEADATKAGDVTLDVGNREDGVFTDGSGAVTVSIAETLTTNALKTDAGVGTLVLAATPDEASDTADKAQITIGEVAVNAKTTTVVVNGEADLTITKLSNNADQVVSASSMTGALTIGTITETATLDLGSGADDITVTTAGKAVTMYGNGGDDDLTLGAGGGKLYGGEGNDTLIGGAGADTLSGGAGDDTLTIGAAKNTVSLGDGADTVIVGSAKSVMDGTDDTTISDFVKGTDKLILTGAAAGDVELNDLTVSSATYTFGTNHKIKLTGNDATDLTDSVQLGRATSSATTAFTAADGKKVVGSNFDDIIDVAATKSATITLGDGADTYINVATAGVSTITDFVVGEDKIVLTGAGTTGDVDLASNIGSPAATYDLGSTAGDYKFTLTGVKAADISNIVQLGVKGQEFVIATTKAAIGGDFADHVTVTKGAATTFTGKGGADVIGISATGAAEKIVIASGDSTVDAYDAITGYTGADDDILDLPSTNIGTILGDTAVDGITGATVAAGVITDWDGISSVNADNFDSVLAFLAENVGGTDTFAFGYNYDKNGDGDKTDTGESGTILVQGASAGLIVVDLVGLTSIDAVVTAAPTNATDIYIA